MRASEFLPEHELVWAKSKSGPKMKWRCTTGLRQGRVVPAVIDCSQPIDVAQRARMKLTRANTKIRQARKAKKTKRVNPASKILARLNALTKGYTAPKTKVVRMVSKSTKKPVKPKKAK